MPLYRKGRMASSPNKPPKVKNPIIRHTSTTLVASEACATDPIEPAAATAAIMLAISNMSWAIFCLEVDDIVLSFKIIPDWLRNNILKLIIANATPIDKEYTQTMTQTHTE